MPEKIGLDEILATNPQVDQERLEEGRELRRHLRDLGVRPKGYGLAPPFGGRRASVHDDERDDRAAARLIPSKWTRDTE